MIEMCSSYESWLESLNLQFFLFLGELWVHLAIFETTLRNFLNVSLASIYESPEWWSVTNILRNHEQRLVKTRRTSSPNTSPIDQLSIGFWVTLLSKKYHERIWRPITTLYPHLEVFGRRKFQRYLMVIQEFRNKLAHHNLTLTRNIARDIFYMEQITSLIAPTLTSESKQRAEKIRERIIAIDLGSGGGI